MFSDVLHQRLHELEQASIVYCKQGRDQARECERKQEMHCYCVLCIVYWVLRIVYWVLCIEYCVLSTVYCILQIRNCLLCIAYCDIVSWSECERKWECIGLASAWYSYQTLLLRNRPTQLLDWLCCFAPLWKQLTFPFSKCFFPVWWILAVYNDWRGWLCKPTPCFH